MHSFQYPLIIIKSLLRATHSLPWSRVADDYQGHFTSCVAQGIGRALVEEATTHLKTLGCSQTLLNAAPSAKEFYDKFGFAVSDEMRLEL